MTPVQRTSQSKTITVEPEKQPAFKAFPKSTLLETGKGSIAEIAKRTLREGQGTHPIYQFYQWFARHLGLQFRALLTGLSLKHEEADQF
jgi:hypothetical protein